MDSPEEHSTEAEVGLGGDVAQQDAWESVSQFYRSCPTIRLRGVSKHKRKISTLRNDESELKFV